MKHLTKEDWEKEFEKQYPFWNSGCKCMEEPTEPATQDIKSFIKSTIEKERKELQKDVMDWLKENRLPVEELESYFNNK